MPNKEQWETLLKIGEIFNRPELSEQERLALYLELTAKAIKAQKDSGISLHTQLNQVPEIKIDKSKKRAPQVRVCFFLFNFNLW